MKRLGKRLGIGLLLAVAAAVLVPAITAFGHAAYDHSTPNADEVVATPPTELQAFFKEEIKKETGAYFLRVEDSSGAAVSDGDGTLSDDDRTLMTATFPSTLANGQYIVRWKTTSDEDGDEAEGAFCFYVVDQPTDEQAAACAALNPTDEEEPTSATTQATTAATTQPEASPTEASSSDDSDSDNSVLIGVIVAVVVVGAVGGGVFLFMRQRRQS